MERTGIYKEFRDACRRAGTNISTVLKNNGFSTGVTGGWKNGQYPRLDIAMTIAESLNISLDELCYGIEKCKAVYLDDNQREWLYIIANIPMDRQELCKEFLKTHATIPPVIRQETS